MSNQELSPEQKEAVRAIYAYAARLMKDGQTGSQVEDALVQKGLGQEAASGVVANLIQARAKAAKKNMLYGALWCIGGIIVTVVTLGMAVQGGGTYIVAWGAIIFGAIQFFRGLIQLNKS